MGQIKKSHQIKPRATIVDIAKELGLSQATVSNALNGRPYVKAKTQQKVEEAALRLGYKPNLRAQRLRTGSADTIALFSSMPFSIAAGPSRLGFFMEIAAVAASAALANGMALILVPPQEKAAAYPIEKLAIDGAIVIEPETGDDAIIRLQQLNLPIVTIGRQLHQDSSVPFIDLNSEASTALLLDHLQGQGAKHIILVIGSARRNSYAEAETAYLKFIKQHNYAPLILRLEESEGEDAAFKIISKLLITKPDIDGLCIPVDVFAVGAARAIASLGRVMPNDIKIVTRYDGLRARQSRPSLTALDLHLDQVAAQAIELLMEYIRGNSAPAYLKGPMPTLIPRGSSVE